MVKAEESGRSKGHLSMPSYSSALKAERDLLIHQYARRCAMIGKEFAVKRVLEIYEKLYRDNDEVPPEMLAQHLKEEKGNDRK